MSTHQSAWSRSDQQVPSPSSAPASQTHCGDSSRTGAVEACMNVARRRMRRDAEPGLDAAGDVVALAAGRGRDVLERNLRGAVRVEQAVRLLEGVGELRVAEAREQ